jgi:peptidoglycan hydrolase-like protein with peptidoglycan-binding domain
MKRWAHLALVVAIAGGCGHAKTTDAQREKAEAETEEAAPEKAPAKKEKSGAPAKKQDPEAVPVAGSPEGLLAPGADEEIREKLAAGGYLKDGSDGKPGSTREGIRRFQKANDLPATGTPDHMTVRKLGLDPDRMFRRQAVKD